MRLLTKPRVGGLKKVQNNKYYNFYQNLIFVIITVNYYTQIPPLPLSRKHNYDLSSPNLYLLQ